MKIQVEVTTPGNGKTYEVMLDDNLAVSVAKEKIIEEIQSFENVCIEFGNKSALFSTASRSRLPENRSLRGSGLCGGHKLILL